MTKQKSNLLVIALGALLLLAFLIRIFHLKDWLYFQADQVRNTNHAHEILEKGWGGLPLLGPKAGGTDFHLGPISYYLEATPALLFGLSHPAVIVYSNLFFVLASILLVYIFLRQGFNKFISFSVSILYAFSYVTIQYSRFSWNPNGLLFWGLLFVFSLYKLFQSKKPQQAGYWLLLLSLSYGISSQLHTTALFGYPLVFLCYWLYQRACSGNDNASSPKNLSGYWRNCWRNLRTASGDNLGKVKWTYWLGAILILVVLYSPVIIYDWNHQGKNWREFTKALVGKTTGSDKTVGQKLFREINLMGKYYTLNVFSLNHKEITWGSKKNHLIDYLGLVPIVLAGILLFFSRHRFFASPTLAKIPKDFLVLNLIWWVVFFILFFPLAYKLDQIRFWFIDFLAPFVALAVVFAWLREKVGEWLVLVLTVVILLLNLSAVANWYLGLAKQDGQLHFWRQPTTSTLQQSDFVTYQKMAEAVAFIKNSASPDKICIIAPSKNRASYAYIFKRSFSGTDVKFISAKNPGRYLAQCRVYLIKHSRKNSAEIIENYRQKNHTIKLSQPRRFGLITVWQILDFK